MSVARLNTLRLTGVHLQVVGQRGTGLPTRVAPVHGSGDPCHFTLLASRAPPTTRRCTRLAVVFLVLGAFVPVSRAAPEEKRRYELSAGDAATTLQQFVEQSGEQVIYLVPNVRGVTTNPVEGRFSARDALDRMLAETGLAVVEDFATGALMINGAAGSEQPPASPQSPSNPELQASKSMKQKNPITILLSLLVFGAAPMDAQTAAGGGSEEKEVVKLSPFVVSTEQDVGYQATNTLAGTRLSTNLKDLGASIQVVTKEFLEDTRSNTTEDLLVYTTNTEVAGLTGNFTGPSSNQDGALDYPARTDFAGTNRIRGLENANRARDLFESPLPFDSYNTERVDINRGVNSVLFGLGRAGGVINTSLKKANFIDANTISLSAGSWGESRAAADLNRVLIPKTLAIRLNTLYQDGRYEQDEAYNRDKRIFAAATYEPKLLKAIGQTTIRANYERGNIRAVRPDLTPPGDRVNVWFNNGKFTWDGSTTDFRNRTFGLVGLMGETFAWPTFVFAEHDNPRFGTQGNYDAMLTWRQQGVDKADPVFRAMTGPALFSQDFVKSRPDLFPVGQGFYRDPVITDRSIFDYRNNMIAGPNDRAWADFQAVNVTLEQLFLKGEAGVEVAYDRQTFDKSDRDNNTRRGSAIGIDINTHLLNGETNPNFGRPFTSSVESVSENEREDETFRATGFFKFNPSQRWGGSKAKWLGRHTFTALYTTTDSDTKSVGFGGGNTTNDFPPKHTNQGTGNIRDFTRRVSALRYLGPSLADRTSAAGANIPGVTVLQPVRTFTNGLFWNRITHAWEPQTAVKILTYDEDRTKIARWPATVRRTESESLAFMSMSHFLDDHLAVMLGWRDDEILSFSGTAPEDPIDKHYLIDDPRFVVGSKPDFTARETTFTWSSVVHIPEKWTQKLPLGPVFSLHYAESDNFTPSVVRFTIYGDSIAPPTGETREYGFSVSLLEGKLQSRFNWYDTASANASAFFNWGWLFNVPASAFRLFPKSQLDAIKYPLPPQKVLDRVNWQVTATREDGTRDVSWGLPPGTSDTRDTRSTGFEAEVVFNPTSNWRMMLNVAQQKAMQGNALPNGAGIINIMLAEWSRPEIQNLNLNPGGANQTHQALLEQQILNSFFAEKEKDGAVLPEVREWRVNFVANYRFRKESRLRGFNVGGAYRWEDQTGIGYPIITKVTESGKTRETIDIKNPYLGSVNDRVDAWIGYQRRILSDRVDWKLQLNVRNLLNNDALIPAFAQPNGSIATYRIPTPLKWYLTSTFGF